MPIITVKTAQQNAMITITMYKIKTPTHKEIQKTNFPIEIQSQDCFLIWIQDLCLGKISTWGKKADADYDLIVSSLKSSKIPNWCYQL